MTQAADISAILNSFSQLGQANAMRRQRDEQARREKQAREQNQLETIGAIGGGTIGAYFGGPPGAIAGATIGSQIGRGLGGGQMNAGAMIQGGAATVQAAQMDQAQKQLEQDRAAQQSSLSAMIAQNQSMGTPEAGIGPEPASPQQAALLDILRNAKETSRPYATAGQGIGLLNAINPNQLPKEMVEKEIIRDGKTYIQSFARTNEGLRPLGEPVLKSESAGSRASLDPYFPGTGLDVSATRNLNNLAPKIKDGTATPAEVNAYTTSYNQLSTPSVFLDAQQNQMIRPAKELGRFPKPPEMAGQAAMSQPATGGQPGAGYPTGGQPGAGYPTGTRQVDMKPIPVEQSAKMAMIDNAITSHAQVRDALTTPTGFDRATIAAMNANIPFTEGRALRQQMKDAIEARLRAESGAAVPDTEVERAMDRFMPSSLDSNSSIQSKFDRFETWLKDTAWMTREGRAPRPSEAPKPRSTRKLSDLKAKFGLE